MGTGVETCKNTAKIQNATGMGTRVWEQGMGTGYGNKVWERGGLKEKLKMSRGHMANMCSVSVGAKTF